MDDNRTLRALTSLAYNAGLIAQGHVLTSALNGEQWAIDRTTGALATFGDDRLTNAEAQDQAVHALQLMDTTKPDGGALRTFDLSDS